MAAFNRPITIPLQRPTVRPIGNPTLLARYGVPAGFSRTTYKGVPVTFNDAVVFDDGKNFYYMRAA